MDDVLLSHSEFLKGCLKDCMLSSPELLTIVTKLTSTCVTFANFILVSLFTATNTLLYDNFLIEILFNTKKLLSWHYMSLKRHYKT